MTGSRLSHARVA